jgi:hypothetical protein
MFWTRLVPETRLSVSFSSSSGEALEGHSVAELQMNGQLVALRDR